MVNINPFQIFEKSVRNVLQETSSEKEIVTKLKPHFQSFIESEGLVPDSYKIPAEEKYRQYLLYRPEDEAFSIVAFVWGPGQTAPIHDHLVWGLVGIYEGAIEETRYREKQNAPDEAGLHLDLVDTVIAKKHDISFVYPPNADIHSVRNPFDEMAITIHIYGTDIGKQNRHSYQKEPYQIKPIVTPHYNKVPVYSNQG
ncbi:cysteine dioxygenase family protein [Bacillus sp. UNC41MFS5]|uniref:cysteine dioxygenase family protein n=1 Tax=Bacillus sp. UNC41MFS5 TaxID=1449046 RepID=UPI0006899394|nr:cysteine dioxygenase family protein [Bacillus sp. UNC41MFS5]